MLHWGEGFSWYEDNGESIRIEYLIDQTFVMCPTVMTLKTYWQSYNVIKFGNDLRKEKGHPKEWLMAGFIC